MDNEDREIFDFESMLYTNQELIDGQYLLPFHVFEKLAPVGKVLDVGYGNGSSVLYYASKGWSVVAFDNEPYHQLKLEERITGEDYSNRISFAIGTLPADPLPVEEFAIISIRSVLHFFEWPTIQFLVKQLSSLLLPGGLMITQNHHKTHLYGKNPRNLGPNSFYKHFFSEEEIRTLFPNNEYNEKIILVDDTFPDEKDDEASEFRFKTWGCDSPEGREFLKANYIDIPYHTDIYSVHQKSFV